VLAALSAYIDSELKGDDCTALRAHLAGCPDCLEVLDRLAETVRLCRSVALPETLPPLPESTRQALLEAYRRSMDPIA
jgi:predicted anti-sigma-YlaC factor YlaD